MALQKSRHILTFGLAILLTLGAVFFNQLPSVSAANNTVEATLCDSSPPEITITQPQSDSVTSHPTIIIEGTVVYATQITVMVNGVYNSTDVIGSHQTTFSIPVVLSEGTNTIELEAYYSCNQTETTTNVIVTYKPVVVPPNNGGDTATQTTQDQRVFIRIGGTDVIERIIDNLLGREPLKEQVESEEIIETGRPDYVVATYSFFALFVCVVCLVLTFMPRIWYAGVFGLFGWKKMELTPLFWIIIRSIALTLAIISGIIVQA